ncbi:MAG: kinase [bacterium]
MTQTMLFDWSAARHQAAAQLGLTLQLPAAAAGHADWRDASALIASIVRCKGIQVVGISGSQGSGKSTLARCLQDTLLAADEQAAAVSIDDFYLSRQARAALADQVHPLLQTRGVPGTHDWQWLHRTLDDVHRGKTPLVLPVFDKGLDDRVGERDIEAGVLVLEGWCLGVNAQPETALAMPCNTLEKEEDAQGIWRRWVNAQLRQHYESLWPKVDLWVHLRVPGFAQVYAWRNLQEQQVPVAQRMSEAQIARFIAHYERLTKALWEQPPATPGLVLALNEQHRVTDVTVSLTP